MGRLLLVRHGPTACTRRAAFPTEEPLDEGGRRDSQLLRDVLKGCDAMFCSPAVRAYQTAAAACLDAECDRDLAECDFGSWSGLTLDQVNERDPEGLRSWFVRPDAAPHGGESQTEMAERVRAFLARAGHGTTVAVTHGGVIKTALLELLGAPFSSFWRIDIAPLSVTELRRHDGTWTVTRTNWTVC